MPVSFLFAVSLARRAAASESRTGVCADNGTIETIEHIAKSRNFCKAQKEKFPQDGMYCLLMDRVNMRGMPNKMWCRYQFSKNVTHFTGQFIGKRGQFIGRVLSQVLKYRNLHSVKARIITLSKIKRERLPL